LIYSTKYKLLYDLDIIDRQMAESNYQLLKFMKNNFLMSSDGIIRQGKYHTLITSMFSHKDSWHLAANMITLYFFGSDAILYLGKFSEQNLQEFCGRSDTLPFSN